MSRTFMELWKAGEIPFEEIDDYVDRWHSDPSAGKTDLHEFLGMTLDEYGRWLRDPHTFVDPHDD